MKDNEVRKPGLVEVPSEEKQETNFPMPPVVLSLGQRGQRAFKLDLIQSKRVLEPAYGISKEIGDKARQSVAAHLGKLVKNLQTEEELQKAA